MFIANIICTFTATTTKKNRETVENGRNVKKRCWYAAYNLNSCRAMLQEAEQKLATLQTVNRPDDDFRIACWKHTMQVLRDEIDYRMRNDID